MKIKLLLKVLPSSFLFSIILFLSAGRIAYMQGWLFFVTNIVTTLIYTFAYPNDNELMQERGKVKEGAKSWDKILLGISAIVYLINIILAGLDSGRFHWSPNFGWQIYFIGILLTIVGQIIFVTALRQNKFFSSIVRIQKDRGHIVCDTGVYAIVRHPGYLRLMLSLFGIPFLTGSVWSFIPTSIAILLLIIRTSLEDNALKNELDGYIAYSKKTRNKLIPWIW